MSNKIDLFSAQTTDGNSAEFSASDVNPNQKADPMLGLVGTFGGALVKLQWKAPDDSWNDTDTALDAWLTGKLQPLYLNSFSKYRLNLSGATGTTSISAWAFGANS